MDSRIPFQKPYTNSRDLISLLQSRGLVVSDPAKAERYLEYIGYYRLSAYTYPVPRSPEFAIREARISAFAMRKNNDKRLPWYDRPTV